MGANRIVSLLGAIILLVFYFIFSAAINENEKMLKVPPYTNQEAGYFAISGTFKSDPLYPINEHIQAIYAKLQVEGIYEEEVTTYDTNEDDYDYETRTVYDPITTHEWHPTRVYFLANGKKFMINDLSMLKKVPLKQIDISKQAISSEGNQILIRVGLGEQPFEYKFTPTKDYEEIQATLQFIPTNIPYTIFCNVQNDQLIMPDYERDFYVFEGTVENALAQLKSQKTWMGWLKWIFLLGTFLSAGYFIRTFFKSKDSRNKTSP